MANKENENKLNDMSLEEAFEKLDKTIEELEGEDVTLERSFALYKEGMELVKFGKDQIDLVEKKVLELGKNGEVSEFS